MIEKIDEIVSYRERLFRVLRKDTENDGNWDGDISFTCHAMSAGELGPRLTGLVLRPLWNLAGAERELAYKNKFKAGDYFQQAISNARDVKRFAGILHDFLLEHGSKYALRNVFSTLEQEDGHGFSMSPSVVKFWDRRVNEVKAQFDKQLKRYRILMKH